MIIRGGQVFIVGELKECTTIELYLAQSHKQGQVFRPLGKSPGVLQRMVLPSRVYLQKFPKFPQNAINHRQEVDQFDRPDELL